LKLSNLTSKASYYFKSSLDFPVEVRGGFYYSDLWVLNSKFDPSSSTGSLEAGE